MAINFPDSPTVGATHTVGEVTWEWNGTTWTSLGSDAAAELDLKAPKASPTFTGTVALPSTTSIGSVSSTEIGYLDGVTSSVQTQINSKLGSTNPTINLSYNETIVASMSTASLWDGNTNYGEFYLDLDTAYMSNPNYAFAIGQVIVLEGTTIPFESYTIDYYPTTVTGVSHLSARDIRLTLLMSTPQGVVAWEDYFLNWLDGDSYNPPTLNVIAYTDASIIPTELGALNGVTSNIQNQLNAKAAVESLESGLSTKLDVYAAVLATNVNLNDYTIPGAYDSQSGSGTNFPVTQPGMLTVKKAIAGDTIYQTYQTWVNGNNRLYWRGYQGSVGWSPWRQTQIAGNMITAYGDYTTTYGSEVGATIIGGYTPMTVALKNYSLSTGDRIDFIQMGTSQITFTAPQGNLFSSGNKFKTAGQYSAATVICTGYGSFVLIGDLAA